MTETTAKKIGSRQALLSVGMGLLIAQLIMTYMMSVYKKDVVQAFFWFTRVEYQLNILIGALIMLLCGHFYGQMAGTQIILRKRNFVLVGFLCAMAVLLTTAFLAGWTGFFQAGSGDSFSSKFVDYVVKPLYWITVFGAIPALLVGVWFGWRIKKRGEEV
jgi:hypothetical protein